MSMAHRIYETHLKGINLLTMLNLWEVSTGDTVMPKHVTKYGCDTRGNL